MLETMEKAGLKTDDSTRLAAERNRLALAVALLGLAAVASMLLGKYVK